MVVEGEGDGGGGIGCRGIVVEMDSGCSSRVKICWQKDGGMEANVCSGSNNGDGIDNRGMVVVVVEGGEMVIQ